jgi:hypothetical protein
MWTEFGLLVAHRPSLKDSKLSVTVQTWRQMKKERKEKERKNKMKEKKRKKKKK